MEKEKRMLTFDEEKKLIEAAKLLKENCDGTLCAGCIFAAPQDLSCTLIKVPPFEWEIPKPRRFPDEDVALAKALKAFGIERIVQAHTGVYWYDENGLIRRCPKGAFACLEAGEEWGIDEIIAEG